MMKNILKIIVGVLIVVISITSCEKEEMDMPSSFPKLSGSYTYSYYKSWEDGLYEISKYDSWDFDETRKAWNYSCNWSYTESGWTNALKESHSYYLEWKVENGTFSEKLWDNEYADWTSHVFEYINESSFKLDGNLYEKD